MNDVITLLLILSGSIVFILSGIKRRPGIGIAAGVILAAVTVWWSGEGFSAIGLEAPESWANTILWGLLLGTIIQALSTTILEPWIERATKQTQDHSKITEKIRGNWQALLFMLIAGWVMGGLIEEVVYRGFLMTQLATILGTGAIGTIINIVVASGLIFGIAHWYQGISGVWVTGITGGLLGILYVWSGYNLWLPIFTHGFIDTIGIILLAIGADENLGGLFWNQG